MCDGLPLPYEPRPWKSSLETLLWFPSSSEARQAALGKKGLFCHGPKPLAFPPQDSPV